MWAFVLTGLLAPAVAFGHATKLSGSKVQIGADGIHARVEVNAADIDVALGSQLLRGEEVDAALLLQTGGRVAALVAEQARVLDHERTPCAVSSKHVSSKGDHVVVELLWRCPPQTLVPVYDVSLFQNLDPAARHLVTVQIGNQVPRTVFLSAALRSTQLGEVPVSVWRVLWQYFSSGVEHIAIGYDHIAFLIAVMLPSMRFWPLLRVITAFTLAHSVTLSLAVLGLVKPPGDVVEILIAASIVYVAVENFFPNVSRRRWMLTFAFGLIHGFGFAGALAEYGIPQQAVGPALAAFNVGVEVGQLVIVALTLAVAHASRRVRKQTGELMLPAVVIRAISVPILLAGAYWLIERVFG
jgi:hydrogenase/urease accessory protein HupE